jgi:Ca2+-transporting ATPase
MVYSGTVVSYGHGEGIVTATGMATELGKIAGLLQSVTQEPTPLQKRLDQLGRQLAAAALVLVVAVFVTGVMRGEPWREMILVAVSLAVAAIPEALTAVVTIALSLGAQRMFKRRALIRRLPAVETLGSVQVICSDKTGTLTQNRMTVTALDMAAGRVQFAQRPERTGLCLAVTGAAPRDARLQPNLDLLLIAGALCNDALLKRDEKEPEVYRAIGDPTEGALVVAAACVGILQDDLHRAFPRIAELPFDSVRKRMTTVHKVPRSAAEVPSGLARVWERRTPGSQPPPYLAVTKGAIDGMLAIATAGWVEGRAEPLDAALRARIMGAHDELARDGLRILCIGLRRLQEPPGPHEMAAIERELVLLGLVGMMDPPRPEVHEAVRLCRTAGIRPVMITGDHPLTARHIARALGISGNDAFVTGPELDERTDDELRGLAREVSVFARVSPAHKIRLVQAYQDKGTVVAMTGDGVNDAPALKKADIGLAMGITGTDVAKEAAQMVLLDDNFATIVAAVEEGRVVYRNIKKAVLLLLSTSVAEVLVLLLAMALGYPPPFAAVQILWNNLVTEGVVTVNLILEPSEGDEMTHRPISSREPLVTRTMRARMAVMVPAIVVATLGWFVARTASGVPAAQAQTETFTLLAICEWFNVLNCRSETKSALNLGLLRNPWLLGGLVVGNLLQVAVVFWSPLGRVFHTVPFGMDVVVELGVVGSVVLWAEEARKLVLRRRERRLVASAARPTLRATARSRS